MRRRTLANIGMVAAFSAVCLAGISFLAVGLGLEVPFKGGWHLNANFAAAEGVVPEADVDVSGVHVGRVVGINGHNGSTTIQMAINNGIHLRQDVRAVVRPKTQLGEKYVELIRQPNSNAPYAGDGYTIPKAQTGSAVEIDDVLNNMDPQTRQAFSDMLQQLGVALDGRSGDINSSIPSLDQTAANLRPLARTAEARQQQIDRILTDLNVIMAALADENEALGQIVDSGNTAMGAIAQRDQDLAGTVDQASILFGSLDTTFKDLTPADRQSLQQSPATIASARQMFTYTNPLVDKLIPELLLAQINYPSNQLNVTDKSALTLAQEWESAFSQKDVQGNSFRFTNINDQGEQTQLGPPPTAPKLPAIPGSQLLPSGIDFLLRTPSP